MIGVMRAPICLELLGNTGSISSGQEAVQFFYNTKRL